MKRNFKTLDAYLVDLDAIKKKTADKTRGMTTKQVLAYFAASARRVYEMTGQNLRRRRVSRKVAMTGKH